MRSERRAGSPASSPIIYQFRSSRSLIRFKIRLVKDGGCRSKDLVSLNDTLMAGDCLLPDIIDVITRFRKSPIVITTDIVEAYFQFEIDKSHRTFLRFFWRPGIVGDANAPLVEFRAKRLDFGLTCSPRLHQASIKFHLDSEKEKRPSQAALIEELKYSIFMDDLSFQGNSNVTKNVTGFHYSGNGIP